MWSFKLNFESATAAVRRLDLEAAVRRLVLGTTIELNLVMGNGGSNEVRVRDFRERSEREKLF